MFIVACVILVAVLAFPDSFGNALFKLVFFVGGTAIVLFILGIFGAIFYDIKAEEVAVMIGSLIISAILVFISGKFKSKSKTE